MNPTLVVLAGLIAWTIFLLILMELIRTRLVLTKQVPANGFKPDNGNLSPFMQRLARAHANCIEGLPIFGGLLLLAFVSGNADMTDPLAFVLLGARIVQSSIHLASVSAVAVTFRFAAFTVQLAIATYWTIGLLVRL